MERAKKGSACLHAMSIIENIFASYGQEWSYIDVASSSLYDHHNDDLSFMKSIGTKDIIILVIPASKDPYKRMKMFLESLPQDIFRGKTVIQLIIGGTKAHVSIIECCLTQVFKKLGSAMQGIHLSDQHLGRLSKRREVEHQIRNRLDKMLPRLMKTS